MTHQFRSRKGTALRNCLQLARYRLAMRHERGLTLRIDTKSDNNRVISAVIATPMRRFIKDPREKGDDKRSSLPKSA